MKSRKPYPSHRTAGSRPTAPTFNRKGTKPAGSTATYHEGTRSNVDTSIPSKVTPKR